MTAALRDIYRASRDLYHAHRSDPSVPDHLIAALHTLKIEADLAWNAAVKAQTERGRDALYELLAEHMPAGDVAEVVNDVLQAVTLGEDAEDAAYGALGRYSIDVRYPADLPERVAALLTESEAA